MSLFNAGNFRYHWNQTVKARKSKKDAKSKRGGTFLPAIWKTYSPNGSSSPHKGGNSNMSTYLALLAKHPLWRWQARLSWSSVLKYLSLKGKSGMTKWSNYTSDVWMFFVETPTTQINWANRLTGFLEKKVWKSNGSTWNCSTQHPSDVHEQKSAPVDGFRKSS